MTGDDIDVLDPEIERRLRRGLNLLAEQTPAPQHHRRLYTGGRVGAGLVAAAILALGSAGALTLLDRGDGPRAAQPPVSRPVVSTPTGEGTGTAPPLASGITYDLARLVRESPRIVLGSVTGVRHHGADAASGGLPYVLATVSIDRAIRGEHTVSVVAFDYAYGDNTSLGATRGATFAKGQRMLLFLSSSAGTVHAAVDPAHWQVTGGAQGAYVMRGGEAVAPFTLAQVEAQVPKENR